MKISDSDIRKIEQLAGSWQVEMPDERFFANLAANVQERARSPARPWWRPMLAPLAGVLGMLLLLGFGWWQLSAGIEQNRLAQAAADWSVERVDWENIDSVLEELGTGGLLSQPSYGTAESIGGAEGGTGESLEKVLDTMDEQELRQLISEINS